MIYKMFIKGSSNNSKELYILTSISPGLGVMLGLPSNRQEKLGIWVFCRRFPHFKYCQPRLQSGKALLAYKQVSHAKGCINRQASILVSLYLRESLRIKTAGYSNGSESFSQISPFFLEPFLLLCAK